MTTLYEVNPANTAEMTGPLPRTGSYNHVYSDQISSPVPTEPRPDLDLYRYEPPPPEDPYTRDTGFSTTFVGTVGSDTAYVQGERQTEPFTLDEVFSAKRQELSAYTGRVGSAAFEHNVSTLEFWAEGDAPAQETRSTYNGYLATRGHDQLFDAVTVGAETAGGVNAEIAAFWAALKPSVMSGNGALYWDRDIEVRLYDRLTLLEVRDNANQNQWSGLAESAATFNWQWRKANRRVWDDMLTAYDDGDQLQLELIDVESEVYNWPPYYDGPYGQGRILISEMRNR